MAKFTEKKRNNSKYNSDSFKKEISNKITKIKNKNILAQKANAAHKKVFKGDKIKPLANSKQIRNQYMPSFKSTKKIQENSYTEYERLHQLLVEYVPNNNIVFVENNGSWISQLLEEEEENKPAPIELRRKLKEDAAYYYEWDVKHQKNRGNESTSSNAKLRKMVLAHGTAKDVVSALVSYCIDNPVHSLHELKRLVGFISPKRKQKNSKSIDYLANLFKKNYLPDGYVAKEFECHSFSSLLRYINQPTGIVIKHLILWYFEDQIRECYLQLIENLSQISNQEIPQIRSFAVQHLSKLVGQHPKQDTEAALQKIINKVGDNIRKIAGSSIAQLRFLQSTCPELRPLLVTLIHNFIYRPGTTDRTKFYGLCVLKDIYLSPDDELAEKLIDIYLEFFTNCINKGTVDNRFMSCLLRGISQAFHHQDCYSILHEKVNTMYIMCHLVNFNRSVQVAQLIYQTFNADLSDRYYNLLYKMILHPDFGQSGNASNLLNILYKSMVKDTEMERVLAFFKRMLQIALHVPVDFICAILKVISQVMEENGYLKNIRRILVGISDMDLISKQTEKETLTNNNTEKKEYYRTSYDTKCVQPLYARAELSFIWELHSLQNHYHPSVYAFVNQLFSTSTIDYSGDPFMDFSHSKFLDRFVKKKSKKVMYTGRNVYARNKQYVPEGVRNLSVSSKEFRETAEEDIPVDELFLYKYYTNYGKVHKEDSSPKEEIDDDEFERIMRERNFKQFVDPDLHDVDFAKSAVRVNESIEEKKTKKVITEDMMDSCDESDLEEYEEEGGDDTDSICSSEDDSEHKTKSGESGNRTVCFEDMIENAELFASALKSNSTDNDSERKRSKALPSTSTSGKRRNMKVNPTANNNSKRKRSNFKPNKKNKKRRK